MNRGIRVLQTLALPLGYVTIFKKRRLLKRLFFCLYEAMERTTRLELATSTLARWRSTR